MRGGGSGGQWVRQLQRGGILNRLKWRTRFISWQTGFKSLQLWGLMFELEWRGGVPGKALSAALKGLSVALVASAPVRVLQTRTAAVPVPPVGSHSWLWVSEVKISAEAALEAVG